jgi:hypothetical protein
MHSSPSRLQFSPLTAACASTHSPSASLRPSRVFMALPLCAMHLAPTLPATQRSPHSSQLFRPTKALSSHHSSPWASKLTPLAASLPSIQRSLTGPQLFPLAPTFSLAAALSFAAFLSLAAALPPNHSSSLRHSHSDLPHDW